MKICCRKLQREYFSLPKPNTFTGVSWVKFVSPGSWKKYAYSNSKIYEKPEGDLLKTSIQKKSEINELHSSSELNTRRREPAEGLSYQELRRFPPALTSREIPNKDSQVGQLLLTKTKLLLKNSHVTKVKGL